MIVFIVVARVLPPSQLGLFATAATVIAVAELVAENGLGEAVVQAPELDDRLLSAALIVNVILAMVVAGALLAIGPWLETALEASGLEAILSVVVLVILFNAFSYVPQAYLRRRFEFRWLAFRALVATVVSGGVGITMALTGFGVWSLVAQALLAAFLNLVLVWRAKPWHLHLVNPLAAAPLFKVSGHIFGSKLVDFVANRGIELAIAAGAGPAALALWVMAVAPLGGAHAARLGGDDGRGAPELRAARLRPRGAPARLLHLDPDDGRHRHPDLRPPRDGRAGGHEGPLRRERARRRLRADAPLAARRDAAHAILQRDAAERRRPCRTSRS